MERHLPPTYRILPKLFKAIQANQPVVALESAVITHGLPYPQNSECAQDLEQIISQNGASPATIALLDGRVAIGLTSAEISLLARSEKLMKLSVRNIAVGIASKRSGGTTVAATLLAARTAGIQVFATGGIGGVHRGSTFDVSADLDELARSRVVVVCSGAKSILDLPATLEVLESRGIPVIGFGTDEFPAFYARSSGLKIDAMVDTPAEIAAIARAHWAAGNSSAILVCNPLPAEFALDGAWVDSLILKAVDEAKSLGVSGPSVTPYLLGRLRDLTGGKTLTANLALLRNNASLSAEIAKQLASSTTRTI
jgi:pseudouridylate synthase